jgi:hypothetical protein
MSNGIRIGLLSILLASWVRADLPPIPAECWEVKESETKECGAIVLERTLRFHSQSVDHSYLIRVLNERGKSAVEFQSFPANAKIEGRTVTREGATVLFKAATDFQTKALVEFGGDTLQQQMVIPPGLTSDCLVQIQWSIPTYLGTVGGFMDYRVQDVVYSLASHMPIRRMELEVDASVGWAYDLQTGPRGSRIINGATSRKAIFTDLPPYEWVPFSEVSAKDNPKFVLYQQPRFLMEEAARGEVAYWTKVAESWWHPYYDAKCQYGKKWGDFSEEIRKNLPSSRLEAAVEIHRRLLARIRDINVIPPEDIIIRPINRNKDKLDPRNFEETLKFGETNRSGIYLLYWVLLRQANIPVKVVRVVDREVRRFRIKQCNLAQFDQTLFMIEEEGRMPLFLEPGRRWGDPALIHPKYQGTDALALVPGEAWTYQVVHIPYQDGALNVRRSQLRIVPSEEKDIIHISSTFAGTVEWTERGRWWSLLPDDRNRKLKESLAAIDPSVRLVQASVGDLRKSPLTWTAEATRERDANRYLEIHPFPMIEAPVFLPKDLPESRTEPIVMPQIGPSEVLVTISIPEGYVFADEAHDFLGSNAVGDVSWSAVNHRENGATEVRVSYRVSTKALVSPSTAYPQLKEFLGWVQETYGRTILLKKIAS